MQVYHYDGQYKFYLSSEEIQNINEEDAKKGLGIPAASTIKKPPIKQCQYDEIPVFKNNEWEIVKDNFWRPAIEEINYDAGRKMDTFKFTAPQIFNELIGFPSIPQLCNSALVAMRLNQSCCIINKKFALCVSQHKAILKRKGNLTTFPLSEAQILKPDILYEFKNEMEFIVLAMRRVLDSIVQLTDLLVNFKSFEKTKTITYDSIGSIFRPKADAIVKGIIFGDEAYEKDKTGFLKILNDMSNGFKHTLMHDESFTVVGQDVPTFISIYVKRANHTETIQYHNHNAYHIMMGFQDCVSRILRNLKIYRSTDKSQ